MIRKELKIVIYSLLVLFTLSVSAMGQKTVGLAVKFTPEAPDSFETALLTLTDDEFSVNIKNIDGIAVFSERFNFINMDIETIEDLVQEVTNKLPDVFEIAYMSRTLPYTFLIRIKAPSKGVLSYPSIFSTTGSMKKRIECPVH